MTRAKATAEGYLWNHGGKVLEYLLLFLTTVLIARGLGVEGNGIFAAIVSFAQLLVVLSSLSLESSLNRFIAQLEATERGTGGPRLRFLLRHVFLVRVLLLIAVIGVAFLAVRGSGILFPDAVTGYFWLLAGYAAVRSIVQLLNMVFVAQLRTAPLAQISVAVRVVELVGIGGMLATGMTVNSVMLFLIATGVLHLGTCFFVGRSDFFGEVKPYSLRPVYAFGAIYWANTIVDFFLGRQGDVLFLTTLLPTPAPASMYNVAFSVVLVAAQGLTLGLGGITLSSFSRLAVTSPQTMDRFYAFLVRIVSVMVLPVLIFIFFNAGPIISVLFSLDFADATILVQGMIVFRVLARLFAGSENAEYLLATGRTFAVVRIGIVGAAANIILDLSLIPRYLAFGAVIGSGCANLLINVLGSLSVRKQAGLPVIQWRCWGLATGAGVVAGMVTSFFIPGAGWTLLIARGVAYVGLTTFFLYLAKPFPAHDIAWAASISGSVSRIFSRFTRQQTDTVIQVS